MNLALRVRFSFVWIFICCFTESNHVHCHVFVFFSQKNSLQNHMSVLQRWFRPCSGLADYGEHMQCWHGVFSLGCAAITKSRVGEIGDVAATRATLSHSTLHSLNHRRAGSIKDILKGFKANCFHSKRSAVTSVQFAAGGDYSPALVARNPPPRAECNKMTYFLFHFIARWSNLDKHWQNKQVESTPVVRTPPPSKTCLKVTIRCVPCK